jgi:hypothetical protein
MERGQGALEYLLLIAGAVLVAVIVLIILIQGSAGTGGLLGESVEGYSQEINADTLFAAAFGGGEDGGSDPPPTPPTLLDFSAVMGTSSGGIHFTYSIENLSPGSFVKIKGWDSASIPSLDETTFETVADSVYAFEQIGLPGPTSSNDFEGILPFENQSYGFYLLTCNPGNLCDIAGPIFATSNETIPAGIEIAFSPTPGLSPASVILDYAVQNLTGGGTITIKGWKTPALPPILDESSFLLAGGEDYYFSQDTPTSSLTNLFEDFMPQANQTYGFYILACDAGNTCSMAGPLSTSTNGGPSNGSISVTFGLAQTVFDYSTQACPASPEGDIPDMPARAMKMSDGSIQITRSHTKSRMMGGNSFTSLSPSCVQVIQSTLIPDNTPTLDVTTFAHKEWISAIFREPATNKIHMVVHNEYHDPNPIASPPCTSGVAIPGNPCNYFSLTYASAPDTPTLSPNMYTKLTGWGMDKDLHVIGASHLPWPTDPSTSQPAPVFGLPMTSNIVQRGSYYYMLSQAIQSNPSSAGTHGTCVARTNNLSDPSSWRFWDGGSYSIRMGSVYNGINQGPCGFISMNNIRNMNQSLTWNTYLEKYLLVGTQNEGGADPQTCGFYYSLSDDLITWTSRQLLWEVPLTVGPCTDNPPPGTQKTYPSIIDHGSGSINFETSGKTPHLYFTEYAGGVDPLNRDLARIPLTFCDSAKESC